MTMNVTTRNSLNINLKDKNNNLFILTKLDIILETKKIIDI